MSHEASGMKSSDIISAFDAFNPTYDLRLAWEELRLCCAFSDTGTDGDDGGSGGDDGDDGDDGSGSAGTDDQSNGDGINDPEKQRLSREAAKYRNERNETKKQLDEALARLKEIEDSKKDAHEVLQSKLEETSQALEQAKATLQGQAIRLAFFESGAAAQFRNPATALRLLRDDLKDIEVDDEGNADADAIKEAAEALLKAEPYLKAGGPGDDGDDDDDDTGSNPSGRATNGKRKSKDELSRETLAKKFPALRR